MPWSSSRNEPFRDVTCRARPIGVLAMTDEAGPDSKVLCVALGDPSMGNYTDIEDVSPHLLDEIEHFFRVYKQLEPDKAVAVGDWRRRGRRGTPDSGVHRSRPRRPHS